MGQILNYKISIKPKKDCGFIEKNSQIILLFPLRDPQNDLSSYVNLLMIFNDCR